MPKTPILYRETFFTEVRGGSPTKVLKHLEWNAVETELGTMVEPRTAQMSNDATGRIVQLDMTDAGISKISTINEDQFQGQYGTGGAGLIDYNA